MEKYNKEIWIKDLSRWEVDGHAILTEEDAQVLNESHANKIRYVLAKEEKKQVKK